MKVGILTYHNACNYGAVFQAYALCEFINAMGHECRIIDYRNENVENQYKFAPIFKNNTPMINLKRNLSVIKVVLGKKRNFRKWHSDLRKTVLVTKGELKKISNDFDRIIAGSDQVWNTKCTGGDYSYLLDFVDEADKKISYAASFGSVGVPEESKEEYARLLSEFSLISVREQSGADIVKRLCGKDAEVVADPVFLPDRSLWEKRRSAKQKYSNYIFVYQIGCNVKFNEYVHKLSEKTGKKIVYVTDHLRNNLDYGLKSIDKSAASPEEFIRLLSDSDYVVTNSFHCTALSVIFNKDFNAVVKGSEKDGYNTRIYDVLKKFGLENRIVNDKTGNTGKIDYTGINDKIVKEREKARYFLERALGETNHG